MTSTPEPEAPQPTTGTGPTTPTPRTDAGSQHPAPGAARADAGTAADAPAVGAAEGPSVSSSSISGREPSLAPASPPVLDEGTFARILEPRSGQRLPLGDGAWHQLARPYVAVRLISLAGLFMLVLAAAVVVSWITGKPWPWIPGGLAAVGIAWTAAITPRQARSFGYRLREDDLVFRRGILWQRMVAVPYGRMQLVDITHGPLDRAFGIAQLKLVTAAAATGVLIPGLTQQAAEALRDTLIAVAETRRTGL